MDAVNVCNLGDYITCLETNVSMSHLLLILRKSKFNTNSKKFYKFLADNYSILRSVDDFLYIVHSNLKKSLVLLQ